MTNQEQLLGETLWAIAACLTALDTQITAQAQQIEALEQHKRGLMQQLFPPL